MSRPTIEESYRHCLRIAQGHYENFPVASRLLPRRLRGPVAVIYAFARTADDLADEGDVPAAERLASLESYSQQLDAAAAGEPSDDPVFVALAHVLARHRLPVDLFHDLLHAFSLDVTKKRYANYADVLDYCRYSANPVGRLLLHLQRVATPRNLALSDAICSALQLINFYQDLGQDAVENDRIYLPQDEMARFGVTEAHLHERRTDEAMRALMDVQYQRTRALMVTGAPLGGLLKGRFGLELRVITLGGLRVLDRLARQEKDLFSRPRLTTGDWLTLFWHAALPRTAPGLFFAPDM